MTSQDAFLLLNELRKLTRYWSPTEDERVFLEDVDFDIRIGEKKIISKKDGDRLQAIYREAAEYAV